MSIQNGEVFEFWYWQLPQILGFDDVDIQDMMKCLTRRGLDVCGSERCMQPLRWEDTVHIARVNGESVKIVHSACVMRPGVSHILPKRAELLQKWGLEGFMEQVSTSVR